MKFKNHLENIKVTLMNHSTMEQLESYIPEFCAITWLVDIKDTIKGFNMILNGELDKYPEAAFNLRGSIDDAIEAGEKMLAEV